MNELVKVEHHVPTVPVVGEETLRLVGEAVLLGQNSKSAETYAAYDRDWRAFQAFCEAEGNASLPAEPAVVAAFVASLVEKKAAVATIERRLAGISYYHKKAGYENPGSHPGVRLALEGAKRTLGVAQKKSQAVDGNALRRLLWTLGERETLMEKRDAALFLVGWWGGLRKSEIVSFKVEDITYTAKGVELVLRKSKTDQQGAGRVIILPAQMDQDVCPVAALETWLKASGIVSGPIFLGLNRTGSKVLGTVRLSPRSVGRIFDGRAKAAGLRGQWSPHGLRAGFITEAVKQGASTIAIASQTGHSPTGPTLLGYVRAASAWEINAATGMKV